MKEEVRTGSITREVFNQLRHYVWSEDCNDAERELLRALVTDEAVGSQVEQHQAAWQSLDRKEIVEMRDDRYRFAVELFRYWILKNHLPASSSGRLLHGMERSM